MERPQVQRPTKLKVTNRKTTVRNKSEDGEGSSRPKAVPEIDKGGKVCGKIKTNERIIKMKLAKKVKGKDRKGDTSANPQDLND